MAGRDLSQAETIITSQSGTLVPVSLKNQRKKPVRTPLPACIDYIDIFFRALSKLISLKTISGSSSHTEECRRGATFLKNLLKQLGATATTLIPSPLPGRNPVVLGQFKSPSTKAKSILFYGHYDVVTASTGSQEWTDDAFALAGRDGFYYARGVSDNKGPILAAMFAAADLLREGREVNITFLIEGEEECGSKGFAECVKSKKVCKPSSRC